MIVWGGLCDRYEQCASPALFILNYERIFFRNISQLSYNESVLYCVFILLYLLNKLCVIGEKIKKNIEYEITLNNIFYKNKSL